MWISSMCAMSSLSDSNFSPQPPNLQALEKKEAAAIPAMVAAALEMRQQQQGSAGETAGEQRWNSWSATMTSSQLVSDPTGTYVDVSFSIKA